MLPDFHEYAINSLLTGEWPAGVGLVLNDWRNDFEQTIDRSAGVHDPNPCSYT